MRKYQAQTKEQSATEKYQGHEDKEKKTTTDLKIGRDYRDITTKYNIVYSTRSWNISTILLEKNNKN